MLVDFHCHLYDIRDNLADEIQKTKDFGVTHWISSALSPEELQWHLGLNKEGIIFTAGIHPHYSKNTEFNDDLYLEKIYNCSDKTFWGIGEIGLDTRNKNFDYQKKIFLKQINLAIELQKPILIHSVKSYYEIFKLLKLFRLEIPIILHGFNGSPEIINLYKKLNIYFSVNKQIFRKKSVEIILNGLIKSKRLLFETDTNSQKNHLRDLEITIKAVSEKLGIPILTLLDYYEKIAKKLLIG